jgi:hypothetical protein
MSEYDDTYDDDEYDVQDYAPDGWRFVEGADGEPLQDQDGDLYIRNADGETVLWDPTDNSLYQTEVDFDKAAADAVTGILEANPRALEYLAEAQGLIDEDGNLIEDTPPAPAGPSPDQTYEPKTPRNDSLSQSLDQGIDEILGANSDNTT